jgi:Zn-dependent metalloprotease
MLFRRAIPLVSVCLFSFAACNPSTIDQPQQQREIGGFVAGSAESMQVAEELAIEHLYEVQPALLDGVGDVWGKEVAVDEFGEAHVRLAQTLNNIQVFSGDAIIHLSPDGVFNSMTDKLVRDIQVDTAPALLADEAIDIAIATAGGSDRITGVRGAELHILRHEGADFLTYRVQLDSFPTHGEPAMPEVFVDAHRGDVVWQYNALTTQRDRKTYDANSRNRLPGSLARTEAQGATGDWVVDLAHDNAGLTYDFYASVLGRDGFDGSGGTITSTVHYQRNYVNAFWNGTQMVYGDGDGTTASPLVVLDVVGHELTHAVTNHTSNLVYSNESGALNEAMSDIFGAAIEAYRDGAVSGNTWMIGEECWTPNVPDDALRYMNDPTRGGDYDYYPTRYTGTSDNGGVHWNSGIANLAFYLMVSGGTHPRDKTSNVVPALDANTYDSLMMGANIFYRANTTCLTSGSTFMDARGCTQDAASALYGATAVAAVSAAWDAVGVPAPPSWVVIDHQSGLSATKNQQLNFSYATPAGAKQIKFELSGSNGDADLYVKFGSAPTTASYDCRSISSSSNESCTINPAQQGTYHVMISAYSAYNSLTLKVSSAD